MRKLTLQAIADAANVSCATVSRCLSGREGVGEQTRKRVLQLCREMGYSGNFVDTAPNRSGCIGFLCPDLADPLTALLARHLERYLAQHDYCVLAAQSGGNRQQEAEALQRLLNHRVDGVIMIPATKDSAKLLRGCEPVTQGVFLNTHLGDRPESYVAVDHFLGGQAAVRYLYGKGHRKILFLGDGDSEISDQRRSGAVSTFRQLRLEGVCADIREKDRIDWSASTAVVAANWTAARAVPGDQEIVCFDRERCPACLPGVASFDTPGSMAEIAAGILLEQLERPIGGYSHRMVVPQLRVPFEESEVSRNG